MGKHTSPQKAHFAVAESRVHVCVATLIVLALAWALLDRSLVWAQERQPLALTEFKARMDFEAEYYRDESQSRQGGARTVIQHSIFRHILRTAFAGYSFDPRLLQYRVGVDVGYDLLNSKFQSPFPTVFPKNRSSLAGRIAYDLLLQFLPESVNSVTLWSRRRDYLMTQLLYDAFEIREQAYGARFDTRWRVLPQSIEVEWRDMKERGLFESEHDRIFDVLYQARKEWSENNVLNILYEYMRLNRERIGQFQSPRVYREDEQTQRLEAYHEYRFGPDLRSSLLSQISVLDQKGTFPFLNILARERLILQHTPNFQTYYGLTYQQTEVGLSKVRTETIEAGLRHQLYENLITRVEARYRHSEETAFSWNEGDVLGNWNYRRHDPFGELFINYLVRETRRRFNHNLGTTNRLNDYFEILQEFRNYARVFYRMEDQRLRVPPGPTFAITQSTLQTVGYEIPWREYAWLQEYRHLDDTIGLTDSLRSELRAIYRLPAMSSLHAALMDEEIDYHGRLQRSRLMSAQVDYMIPFARTGLWQIEAAYDHETGIINQDQFRLRSAMEWQWRKLKLRFSGQYGLFQNDATEQQGTHLLFSVSRDLR